MLQSPDIGQNSDGDISDFQISGQSLIKENCHNSRANVDIDMKFGSVTKIDKRNKITSKKLTTTSCQKTVTSLSFFGFLANLESAKVMFSVIVTFSLTKPENRTKTSLIPLSHCCFEKRYFFGRKMLFFCKKNDDISKIKRA